jgi:hypothetical protein
VGHERERLLFEPCHERLNDVGLALKWDAAVGANIGSEGATAEAVAPQDVNVEQNLDNVQADAQATQDANVQQQ